MLGNANSMGVDESSERSFLNGDDKNVEGNNAHRWGFSLGGVREPAWTPLTGSQHTLGESSLLSAILRLQGYRENGG